jgi:predicted transposase YdaD
MQTLTAQADIEENGLLEFVVTVLAYKLPNLSREELRVMLALNDVKFKKTRFYQEVLAEGILQGKLEGLQAGIQEGLQEGIQQGKLEGIQEGALKGETQFLTRLLSKRYGALPHWAEQKLSQADLTQLERWGERFLEAQTLAEVFD